MSLTRPVTTALLLACGSATAQTYRLHMVPEPPILGSSYVFDMNSGHRAVGTAMVEWLDGDTERTSNRAYRSALGGLAVETEYSAYLTVNDAGDVVTGEAIFRGADGTEIVIEDIVGYAGWPTILKMNNQQMVVGYSGGTKCYGHFNSRNEEALLWMSGVGTMSLVDDFGVPAAAESRDINEVGQIVGIRSETRECSNYQAYMLDTSSGEWVDLHEMLTGGRMGTSEATAINDLGIVAGEGTDYLSGVALARAWVWSLGKGFTFLPGLTGGLPMDVHPKGINNQGQVVGAAINGDGDWRAFIWDASKGMRDLNALVKDLPSDWRLSEAFGITDDGWVYGLRHNPVTWTPVTGFVVQPLPTLSSFRPR